MMKSLLDAFAPWAYVIGPTRPRSPWRNRNAERLIGSIRRDWLDHVEIFGERHLRRLLAAYMHYCKGIPTHLSLSKDAPIPRSVCRVGRIFAIPIVVGLH